MSLQTTTKINVDFYDKKYILINAKQYDKSSRFVLVTCYNHGDFYPVNSNEHSAYIRYRKSDGNGVFNLCEIVSEGRILIELTEQMLAVSGVCYADLVIVNKGDAEVDADTGEITAINNTSILSTMTFCIDVSASAIENSEVESSYEYDGLNELLQRAEADYQNVVKEAKSWAVGDTGTRVNEDINNAKYWAEMAHVFSTGDISDNVVTGIKFESDDTYRVGLVDITPENVGAVAAADIAAVDEVKNYLGI